MLKIDKNEYQNRTFRLPVSLIEKLGAIAQSKNISVNKLVIILCEYGIDNLDQSEE
ncbi:Uncharacterised protein [uncultured Clostridium sp.]|nr:Uncharacterised protein [uncultured Clostridium sp.]